jgi:hypothetical protein
MAEFHEHKGETATNTNEKRVLTYVINAAREGCNKMAVKVVLKYCTRLIVFLHCLFTPITTSSFIEEKVRMISKTGE